MSKFQFNIFVHIIAAFEEALNFMDDIDIVINNAGILDERRWEKEIAVNIVSDKEIVLLSICVCMCLFFLMRNHNILVFDILGRNDSYRIIGYKIFKQKSTWTWRNFSEC